MRTTLVFLVLMAIFAVCLSKSPEPEGSGKGKGQSGNKKRPSPKEHAKKHPPKKAHKRTLNEDDVQIFVKRCAGGKCKTPPGQEKKTLVRQLKLEQLLQLPKFLEDPAAAEEKLNRTLEKILLLKKGIYRLNGLPSDIMPADDGLLSGDEIVQEDQVDFLLTKLLKIDAPELLQDPVFSEFVPDPDSILPNLTSPILPVAPGPVLQTGLSDLTGSLGRRRRRSAMFFDSPQVQQQNVQWRMPVPFFINFRGAAADAVRQAVKEITSKTGGCVNFVEESSPPSSSRRSFVIVFETFSDPDLCGMSTTGRRAFNVIYLNFICDNMKGRAIHEILHVLGVAHHHNRQDRNGHLKIQWNNVKSSAIDFYCLDDQNFYSSFGTPYDFGSIMHYDAWAGAINPDRSSASTAAMVPLDSTVNIKTLGQRSSIGCSDIELLKKMYCCDSGCLDSEALCGAYANQGSCDSSENWFWMEENCPKSCEICCQFPCHSSCEGFCAKNAFGEL